MMMIGAQLFTVREFTTNLDDFAKTLKRVSDIGYKAVQVSATCAYEPQWLAKQLKKNGLVCPVTHTNGDLIKSSPLEVAQNHQVFDCGIVGLGMAPGGFQNGMEDYKNFCADFISAANEMNKVGVKFGYHNHHVEFQKFDGVTLLERMFSDFPKDAFEFILDTYWVQYSGGNPANWIRKLAGQVNCVHFKDMQIVGQKQLMAPVGEGNLCWDEIIKACEYAGTKYVLVEQDDCNGEDPFDCLKRSFEFLKSKGLE
ncbi:sugar phosphate isomerase/epimerase family protein [Scatolibacter rhodanostii]|uniref:sugar phosphate isomerase/epimerase family protein n=1 Tax=Scatolibacter rhodanostii TaxID=2014781 RepID=UPI000C071155|nr:sugar phosphate isomerase/epimerase [Scatolibacter rhodanostii]